MASEARDISAKPAAKQVISHDGKRYTTIREGLAYILVPETLETAGANDSGQKLKTGTDEAQSVFYNPIQQFNRDLSVLAIKAYGEEVMERRTKAVQKRREVSAGKKRKRQERREQREQLERPHKMGKLLEPDKEGGLGPTTHTETEVSESKEPATESADADTAPHAEEGSKDPLVRDADEPAPEPLEDANPQQKATIADTKNETRNGPRVKILDALSATGLRALRYAHELPFATTVTANDLLEAAVESIKLNVRHNNLEEKIVVNRGNALAHMYSLISDELSKATGQEGGKHQQQLGRSEKYDVIDLDPYGTAATFLDAAVQAIRDDGGLLCITCTDSGVWASNGYPEKCFALYGGVPVKAVFSHEVGLRLILHAIATSAARYGLAVDPLLSLSIDYYARVFVRVTRSPASVKFQAGKTMMVYNCDSGCGAWETQLLLKNKECANKRGSGTFYKHGFALAPTADKACAHCGHKMHLAGPMYAGKLHSPEFIKRILDYLPNVSTEVYGTTDRIRGMLVTALEELMDLRPAAATKEENKGGKAPENGQGQPHNQEGREVIVTSATDKLAAVEPYPFFFIPSMLAKVVHCVTPDEDAIRGALRLLGYRVTRSHCKPGSIKTDAPWAVVWDVMREWVRQKAPVKEENIKPGTAGYHILKMGKNTAEDEPRKGTVPDQQQQASEIGEKESVSGTAKKAGIIFDSKFGREKNGEKLVRYQVNPRENWGPMSRATG